MDSKKTVYDSVDKLLETGIKDPSIHIANGVEYSTLIAEHRMMKEFLQKRAELSIQASELLKQITL